MDLIDRRILVTGGTSGIGLELARRLAGENRVIVASRQGTDWTDVDGLAVHGVRLDVTDERSVETGLAEAINRLGGLDILVNSAGILRQAHFSDAAAGDIEAEIEVNLLGSLRATRLALPHLRRSDDGAVVFVSSALAVTAAPGLASYAATKAAVHSLARSLRAELHGAVKVFDVLPPFVDTALAAGFAAPKVSPGAVADAIVKGLRQDRFEMPLGRVAALAWMARLWPGAADRIIAREIGLLVPATGAGPESEPTR